jgi:hypothetical protein
VEYKKKSAQFVRVVLDFAQSQQEQQQQQQWSLHGVLVLSSFVCALKRQIKVFKLPGALRRNVNWVVFQFYCF